MACIEKIYSVSALVGNGACNGNCEFCAGKYLRPQAPKKDDEVDPFRQQAKYYKNLEAAIKLSARYGGWSLSLTGAGEPTVDPWAIERAMRVYKKCADQGAYFPNVNLFTNGIAFADKEFCQKWLPRWKGLGMTNVAVSVHGMGTAAQARAYGFDSYGARGYPWLDQIFDNIRAEGMGLRVTLLLRKGEVEDAGTYQEAIDDLIDNYGVDNITSWPVSNPDGTRNEHTPSRFGLWSIRLWLKRHAKICHGHVWGGGVYDYRGSMLRMTDYVTKHDPKKDFVRQLVVFQDATVAYSWIREGALCMK